MTEVRRILPVVLAAVLLAGPAPAQTIEYINGFESGADIIPTGSSEVFAFDGGNATVSATNVRDDYCDYESANAGTLCATNGDCDGGECVEHAGNDFAALLDTSPWSDGRLSFVVLRQADAAVGCRMELEAVTADSASLAYAWGDVTNVCTGASNDGTPCEPCDEDEDCTGGATCFNGGGGQGACDNECPAPTDGEQWCVNGDYGSAMLAEDVWTEIVLCQDNEAASVYEATCVGGRNGRESRRTRAVATCLGGANAGWACDEDADCPSSTCDPNVLADVDQIEIGFVGEDPLIIDIPDDPQACVHLLVRPEQVASATQGWKVRVDDIIVQGGSTDIEDLMVARVLDVWPDSTTSEGFASTDCAGGTDNHQCVDEGSVGTAADGDTTEVNKGTGSPNSDIYTLSDITVPTGWRIPSPMAVAVTEVARDQGDASDGAGKLNRTELGDVSAGTWDDAVPACSANSDCFYAQECMSSVCWDDLTWQDDGAEYWPRRPAMFPTRPTGGAWTEADVDDLKLRLTYDVDAAKSHNVTSVHAETFIVSDGPPLPGILDDYNGDGETHVRVVSDSVFTPSQFHDALTAALDDPDNLSFCTRGSTRIEDARQNWDDILDGLTGTYMLCTYTRGSVAPVDHVILTIGVNTMVGGPVAASYCGSGADKGEPCAENADCAGGAECTWYPQGYCRGGTDHGSSCLCDTTSFHRLETSFGYCANASVGWASTNADLDCDACTTDSDCDTEIPCSVNSDCGLYTCQDSTCRVTCNSGDCANTFGTSAYTDASDIRPSAANWRLPGCISDDCSGGICWAAENAASYEESLQAIIAATAARTGSGVSCTDCKAKLYLAPEWRAEDKAAGFWGGYTAHTHDFETIAEIQRQAAANNANVGLIDLNSWWETRCADATGDRMECYGDAIHASPYGWQVSVDAIEYCMEQTYIDAEDDGADGICGGTACTQGLLGAACSTNSDCDLMEECPTGP